MTEKETRTAQPGACVDVLPRCYGRWERKEQEVAGKSGLEIGEKGGKYTTLLDILPSKKGLGKGIN